MKEHPDYKYRPRRKPKPMTKTPYSFPMPYIGMSGGMNPAAAGLDPLSWFSAAASVPTSSVNTSTVTSSLDLDKSRLFGFPTAYGSQHPHPYYGMTGHMPMGLGLPNLGNNNNCGSSSSSSSSLPKMSPDGEMAMERRMDLKVSSPPMSTANVITSSAGSLPSALYSSLMYTKAAAAASSFQASRNAAAAAMAAANGSPAMQYPPSSAYPSLDQLAGLRRPVPVIY